MNILPLSLHFLKFNKALLMNFTELSPNSKKQFYLALGFSSMLLAFFINKSEKFAPLGQQIYWANFLMSLVLFQKAVIAQETAKEHPRLVKNPQRANFLSNIYLAIISIAITGAIIYDHFK